MMPDLPTCSQRSSRTVTKALFRRLLREALHELIEAELTAAIGAAPHVSRICAKIDEDVNTFRQRRLDRTTFPYVFCDATYVKARVDGRVASPRGSRRHRRRGRRQPRQPQWNHGGYGTAA